MGQNKEQWGSRWGFIAASIGMAIGTGNIWRFPRVAAKNGGGPFIIAWTVALLVWSIPLLMGEMVIGKKTRLGTIGSFRDFLGKKFTWMGSWIAAVCLLIMFYYSVVMGWCMKYFTLSVSGAFKPGIGVKETELIWNTFTTTPSQTILFHFIAMSIAGFIIYKGVTNGIEKASKIMIPTLFVLLLIALVRSVTLPGAAKGLEYLFSPKLSMLLNPKIWLEAFTQSAWSTGAGWGFIVTYAVYTKENEDIGGNCMIMGLGNNVGALVAGMTVLPAIFALSPTVEFANEALSAGNQGITFIYLAQLFSRMPAGGFIAALFFLTMSIAALSSLLPMIEVGVRNVMDMGLERNKATIVITVSGFLLGIPSAYSLHFLDNQDFVWGVGLLVSGLFFAIALTKYGLEELRTKDINIPETDFIVGKWWNTCIRLFPIFFVIILGWWVQQAISWYPNSWWNPFETFSAGSIAFQFTILIIITLVTKNYFISKVMDGPMTGSRLKSSSEK
ncbi:sodium-dependent transporter [Paramaledivibacter caminithermalis]|jgi:NSS family neurotransmitter:Na+ symporter|uniref:Neurotransmitter:Na+ symporter, NSS family n=2 Tax=Paramaledivibacter caminithermalis (strain DSM 15212 / CIP 107654 / DViRD3) TaxID=1121301 RepID=A0A1M6LCL9_PARC5|nr:sodium-dependent transporter [Paramaledivibacter caminithermalis]SHJ68904.1 neurotransmitter:Na+ symporter, NSS family [Paramaledivibacter caminithermalis DSM 15212]SHK52111.1 neurotransmitter:Na+ symporter, NSS family [Paramaledivibacter caminithermalis DSM 15212]